MPFYYEILYEMPGMDINMRKQIGWGIIGAGNIAHKFAEGLKATADGMLIAVGSRSKEKADEFAHLHNSIKSFGSYSEVAEDSDVDVVYVATPHSFHYEHTKMCLLAGKAVLCEKPFTLNASELEELIAISKEKKVFLMEAMWTRFLPVMDRVRKLLEKKVIGEVRMLQADFGYRADFDPQSRIFAPELGGGGLLDVGVYTISLSSMIFGKEPSEIASLAHLGETGVDEQSAYLLKYDRGQLSILTSAVSTATPDEALIIGTEGYIRIPEFWHATKAQVFVDNQMIESINIGLKGNGYEYEAEEVMRCLMEGKLQSKLMSLEESLSIMRTMDKIRNKWRES